MEEDLPATVDAVNEWAALEEDVMDSVSLSEATEWFHSPVNHQTNVNAFALNDDQSEGKLIGFLSTMQNPGDDRAWCWIRVHPDYRNHGLGTSLFAECIRRAKKLGATSIHFDPSRNATLLIDFLQRRGYTIERYFWDMRLEADRPSEAATLPPGFTLRTFVPDQDEALTHTRAQRYLRRSLWLCSTDRGRVYLLILKRLGSVPTASSSRSMVTK